MKDLPESTLALFMSSPTLGYLTRREGDHLVLVAINHKAQAVTKLPPSMIGRPIDFLYADQPEVLAAGFRALDEGRTIERELKLRRADLPAAHHTLRLTLVPLPNSYLAAYSEDFTQPSDVERVLADAEARNASIVATMIEGVLLLDKEGTILMGNAASGALFDVQEAELLRRTPEELGTWSVDGRCVEPQELPWRRALASGDGVRALKLSLQVGSKKRSVLASARPIRVGSTVTSIGCTLTDVTALEESEAALRESERAYHRSERWLDAALQAGQLGVFEWNLDEEEGAWSPHLNDLFGAPLEHGIAGYLDRVHPEDRARFSDEATAVLARPGTTFDVQYRVVRPNGEVRWVRTTGQHAEHDGHRRLLGVIADVSERYRMQEALTRSERLESLGRLAGGVAHDFNNLLTVILSSLSLAGFDASSSVAEEIATARYAAERARDLTSQLLAFARRQIVETAVVDLDALVHRTEQMLRRLVGDEIALRTERVSSGAFVRVDAAQIEQVLVNLVVNARDAMPKGGKIRLATAVSRVSEGQGSAFGLTPGEYVVLEIQDTGEGIEPAVREKLFEPFFSTKATGTGLGLASAYGIVRQLGGTILVESDVGHGATFRVYLPRVDSPSISAPKTELAPQAPGGAESILLVDDDALVRKTTKRVLERLGYTVTVAVDGKTALEIAARAPTPFALLVTDMSMPGMSGGELVRRLRENQPSLRALVVSGNPPPDAEAIDATSFLQKPYSFEDLSERVRQLLSRPS